MQQLIRGATLGELVITLALVAILATTGIPALSGFVANQRITATGNLLVADFNFARSRAVTAWERVVVCPSSDGLNCRQDHDWRNGWIVFADDGSGAPGTPARILRHGPGDSRLVITASRPRVRYLPDGSAAGTNLTVTLCHASRETRARAVIVSNSGRVRSESREADSACAGTASNP